MLAQIAEFWLEAPVWGKMILFFLSWLLLWFPLAVLLGVLLKWQPWNGITPAQKLPLVLSLYSLAPVVLGGVTAVENTNFASYGLPWHPDILRSLWMGCLFGATGLVSLFALEWQLGWIEPTYKQSPNFPALMRHIKDTVLPLLLVALGISWVEELVFRGFLLNQLQIGFNFWEAAALASLIFAVSHLVWEGQETLPQLPGLWLMGMVLSLARSVDHGNLGLAWGLHAGWVGVIATLDTTQVLNYTRKGSSWFTGLSGKPLAGLLGIGFLLGTGWGLWLLR